MDDGRTQKTALMDRASAGDEAAFGELALTVQDDLYRFALAHGLTAADAADAVQEVLLRAYRLRRRWRTGADAAAWLYGIAMNVVRELLRKRRRPERTGLDMTWVAAEPPHDGGAADAGDCRLLAAMVADLPPRQREAVTCRYLRRMSVRQTAEAMGCAEGTVKAAVFAALGNLRQAVRRHQAGTGLRWEP